MEALPIQTPSPSGERKSKKGRTVGIEEGKLTDESRPSIELGLGIGTDSMESTVMRVSKSEFTPSQVRELQLQLMLFQHMVAGLAVPTHLLVSLWKCSSDYSGSNYGGLNEQHRSRFSAGVFGCSSTMMDPEPGRCRRTDGKKWRCRRAIVPHQKYCERHVHRGRKCSRKLVESSQLASLNSASTNLENASDNKKTSSLGRKTPSSGIAPCITSPTTRTINESNIKRFGDEDYSKTNGMKSLAIKVDSDMSMSKNNNDRNIAVCDGPFRSIQNGNNMSFTSSVSSVIHLSPKSVLKVLGHGGSFSCGGKIETEPGRCRRTDGKKWRCSRGVLPGQKYCPQHMHRGAKKCVKASPAITSVSTVSCRSNNWATRGRECHSS